MKTTTLLASIISVGIIACSSAEEPEKPHLCPCGQVHKEMMRTGFSYKTQSQFYTIVLKNRNEWGRRILTASEYRDSEPV